VGSIPTRPAKMKVNMQEHQLRVIEEEKELKIKLNALTKFTSTELFKSLPLEDKDLLLEQGKAMCTYGEILTKRIARF
jgi:hypothetical protein